MAAAVEETAATTEELARSVRGWPSTPGTLETSAAATASTVTEVAASVEEVAATAEKNAATVDANAATIEQLARSAQAVAQSAEQINTLAATSASRLRAARDLHAAHRPDGRGGARHRGACQHHRARGRRHRGPLHRRLRPASASRSPSPSAVMKEMGKRAEEIGDIVQTINLIADRTNLLSLNASIEAARAGEHGRGFAVVAEEIRALADRAAAASADVAKIVRGLQNTAREAAAATGRRACARRTRARRLAADAERALGSILKGVEELGDDGARGVPRHRRAGAGGAGRLAGHGPGERAGPRHRRAPPRSRRRRRRPWRRARRRCAAWRKQTTQATVDQARALRDAVRSNGQLAAAAEQVSRAMQEQAAASARAGEDGRADAHAGARR